MLATIVSCPVFMGCNVLVYGGAPIVVYTDKSSKQEPGVITRSIFVRKRRSSFRMHLGMFEKVPYEGNVLKTLPSNSVDISFSDYPLHVMMTRENEYVIVMESRRKFITCLFNGKNMTWETAQDNSPMSATVDNPQGLGTVSAALVDSYLCEMRSDNPLDPTPMLIDE